MPAETPTQDIAFGPTVELVLFGFGIAMTIGVTFVIVFLVRTMRREDRERLRSIARGEREEGQ
ncbi:MAG: hypothetical protein JNM94_09415 [Phycisphaerae bacterium]|nr:hypothetical protein [Phycisphaerae bacterium]